MTIDALRAKSVRHNSLASKNGNSITDTKINLFSDFRSLCYFPLTLKTVKILWDLILTSHNIRKVCLFAALQSNCA